MPKFIDKISYLDTAGVDVDLNQIQGVATVDESTLSVANAGEAQHAVNADNANHATSADSATNVTANINGKAISSIFESNGTTVKNATNAGTASVANSVAQVGKLTKLWEGTWDGKSVLTINNLSKYAAILVYIDTSYTTGFTYWLMLTRSTVNTLSSSLGMVDAPAFTTTSICAAGADDTSALYMEFYSLRLQSGQLNNANLFMQGMVTFANSGVGSKMASVVSSCTAIYGIETARIPE